MSDENLIEITTLIGATIGKIKWVEESNRPIRYEFYDAQGNCIFCVEPENLTDGRGICFSDTI